MIIMGPWVEVNPSDWQLRGDLLWRRDSTKGFTILVYKNYESDYLDYKESIFNKNYFFIILINNVENHIEHFSDPDLARLAADYTLSEIIENAGDTVKFVIDKTSHFL